MDMVEGSCDFNGVAIITTTNPSRSGCIFPGSGGSNGTITNGTSTMFPSTNSTTSGSSSLFATVSFSRLFFGTPTGIETPNVINLRKQQRKEPEKPLYQTGRKRRKDSSRNVGGNNTYLCDRWCRTRQTSSQKGNICFFEIVSYFTWTVPPAVCLHGYRFKL